MSATKSTLKNCLTYLPTYLILCFLLIPFTSLGEEEFTIDPELGYVPGQLLIQLEGEIDPGLFLDDYVHTGFPEVDELNQKYGVYLAELAWGGENTGPAPPSLANCYVFYFPDLNLDMEEVAEEYKGANGVLEAEPIFFRWAIHIRPPYFTKDFGSNMYFGLNDEMQTSKKFRGGLEPNDYYYPQQWALEQDSDCDIDASHAWGEIAKLWEAEHDFNIVKISQLDTTGAKHVDHQLNQPSPAEYDFIDDDDEPYWRLGFDDPNDYEWHFEPIIGMYSANTNNGPGMGSCIAGINWNGTDPHEIPYENYIENRFALIRVLKKELFGDYWWSYGNLRSCISGMVRSANFNMDIVLMPYGGFNYSAFEEKAAEWLTDWEHEALLIAPAGFPPPNVPRPLEPILYPAALTEVMAIGATDQNDQPTNDTNTWCNIELWAPGKDCVGLQSMYYVSDFQGPAIAAAYVTGVAEMFMAIWDANGEYTRIILQYYCDHPGGFNRLNYYKAIKKTHDEPSSVACKTTMDNQSPHSLHLQQNYPNPVSGETTIPFVVSGDEAQDITLTIYDISGRLIRRFEQTVQSGAHTIVWDGKDETGNPIAVGLYIYTLTSEACSQSRSLVVVE